MLKGCIFTSRVSNERHCANNKHEFVKRSCQSSRRTLFFQFGMNLLIDGQYDFSNGLWIVAIYVVLQKPPEIKKKKKSGGLSLGECGDNTGLQRLLISLLGNQWSSTPSCRSLYVEFSHLVETIAHLDPHHDMFHVPTRTYSTHQCNTDLWQWLCHRLHF